MVQSSSSIAYIRWTSTSSFSSPTFSFSTAPNNSLNSPQIVSTKKKFNAVSLTKKSKGELSKILRTDAAVIGIQKKLRSSKLNNLFPRSVLEALDDAIASNRWESALEIFALLRRQQWYCPRGQTYARLLMMLGKCRQPEHASSLFKTMISEDFSPTLDVYTSLAGAFGRSGLLDEAIRIVEEINAFSDCKPTAHTYTLLIGCCGEWRRFDLIPSLLAEMAYFGIDRTSVTFNTMIDCYGKAGLMEEMESSLASMIECDSSSPDIYTLNSVIHAYGALKRIGEMEARYVEFQRMGVDPDLTTLNILIRAYGMAGMHGKMIRVLDFIKKRFFSPTIVTFNTLIECFGKAGRIEKMEHYFRWMKTRGIKPNCFTYCSIVGGYSRAGLIEKIPFIIREIENTDAVMDAPFFNCVINAYGLSGDIEIMKEMFSLMKEKKCRPDDVTFATMIKAYKNAGMHGDALELEGDLIRTKSEFSNRKMQQ